MKKQPMYFPEEPICWVMQVAPSGYWRYAAQKRNPALRCARVQCDNVLSVDIGRVRQANMQVYGADQVWRQLRRKRTDVARSTVERLMRKAGLRGVVRGKVVRTTVADARDTPSSKHSDASNATSPVKSSTSSSGGNMKSTQLKSPLDP